MGQGERFLENLKAEVLGDVVSDNAPQLFRKGSNLMGDEEQGQQGGGGGGEEEGEHHQMYRLQATRGARDVGCFRVSIGWF